MYSFVIFFVLLFHVIFYFNILERIPFILLAIPEKVTINFKTLNTFLC